MIKNDTPASPMLPAAQLTRRNLFRLGGLAAASAAAPLAAQSFGTGFTHGVASGEPGPDKALLWTRYVGQQDVALEWQVSEDADFTTVVAEGSALARAESDWCAKSWADGLRSGQWYYYRFIAADGSMSDVGRTRTLPEGKLDRFRMAVFSCSNYGFGWFNAYAHAAEANDVELALHLGDYIYEYGRGTYPSAQEAHPDRLLWPEGEIVALADYRLRYATYRSDPDLRRIHQSLPMICIWDDHETANDSWKDGAQNHQSDSEGDWEMRKAAAKRAWREWLPVSDETYTQYEVGDLATLFRLDTRLEGREQQFDLGAVVAGAKSPEQVAAGLTAFRDGPYADPKRQLLGAAQEAWLGEGLKASRGAGKQWQVLVQQVLMGPLLSPPGLAEGLGDGVPDYARRRVTLAGLASKVGLPSNMDAWDGYPAARERLLEASLVADANLVVLAGDTHNAWAFELEHDGTKAGVEFGVQSVASPGLESSLPMLKPDDFAKMVVAASPQLKWADTSQRGYMVLELTPGAASNEFRFVDTIRQRSTRLAGTHRMVSEAGSQALSA